MSINNDGMRSCLWDNNQNILHKLLISVRWFLSFLFKKIGQLKDRVGQVLFSSPDPKGHVSYSHHLASVVVVRRPSVVRRTS